MREGNTSSERMFESCAYTASTQTLVLYVRSVLSPAIVQEWMPQPSVHFLPVKTFNYNGVWIEGTLSKTALEEAERFAWKNGAEVVGTLVNKEHNDLHSVVRSSGFHEEGHYRWWTLSS